MSHGYGDVGAFAQVDVLADSIPIGVARRVVALTEIIGVTDTIDVGIGAGVDGEVPPQDQVSVDGLQEVGIAIAVDVCIGPMDPNLEAARLQGAEAAS